MKKILALTLAAVMAAGMTTVAFAKDGDIENVYFTGAVFADLNGDDKDEMYKANAPVEDNTKDANELSKELVSGGETLYVELRADYEGGAKHAAVNKLSDLKGWEIVSEWDVGANDVTEEPYFDLVKVQGDYGIYLVVTVPENETVDNEDLLGSIGLGDTRKEAKEATGANLLKLAITYGRDKTKDNVEIKEFDGSFPEAYETKGAVVDFDNVDDIIDIEFNDLAMFTVDVTGQGKLDLRFNTKFDKEFADWYDYANIDFLTFPGTPRFNKTGDFYLYAPEDAFIYKKGAEGVEEIRGLEWSDEYDAWHFRTRELSAYVISDVELNEQTVTEDKDDTTTEDGGKQNPDTGR